MGKKLLAVIAAVCLLLGFASTTADAKPESTATTEVSVAPASIYRWYKITNKTSPPDVLICVANGANELPISLAAQSWNNATVNGPAFDFSSNCVADGYGPGQRMTIDTYSALDGTCVKATNTQYVTFEGWRQYYNNPVGWVNTNPSQGCASTAQRRAHWTSFMIGWLSGLMRLDGSTWASRVMCYCSQDTVAYPSASTDGDALSKEYNGTYIGGY